MGGRPCYSYRVAVALSLFLGMLGIDRFYLGYPAIGNHTYFHAVCTLPVVTELHAHDTVCVCLHIIRTT